MAFRLKLIWALFKASREECSQKPGVVRIPNTFPSHIDKKNTLQVYLHCL